MPTPSTGQLIDTAAAAYKAGRLRLARSYLDEAIAQPDAAEHSSRIRLGKDLLVRAGAYDQVWVPAIPNWRRCPALGNACSDADTHCGGECALVSAGWELPLEIDDVAANELAQRAKERLL